MARVSAGPADEFSKRVIEAIEKVRKTRGLAHVAFAEAAGMSENYWHKRLRGELPLNTNDINGAATALGVDPFDLMRGDLSQEGYAMAAREDDDDEEAAAQANHP